tara:strand:- start:269 stop:460 length:192 start_codon:yes stop_codon:yes gene_type:complete
MKLKKNDLVWINHNTFNRFETFKVIEINNESIKIKQIETNQTIDITNKAILKKVELDWRNYDV